MVKWSNAVPSGEKVDFQPTTFHVQEILKLVWHKDLWKLTSLRRVSIQVAGGFFLTGAQKFLKSPVRNILKILPVRPGVVRKKIECRVTTSFLFIPVPHLPSAKSEMITVASMVREGDKKWQEEMYCSENLSTRSERIEKQGSNICSSFLAAITVNFMFWITHCISTKTANPATSTPSTGGRVRALPVAPLRLSPMCIDRWQATNCVSRSHQSYTFQYSLVAFNSPSPSDDEYDDICWLNTSSLSPWSFISSLFADLFAPLASWGRPSIKAQGIQRGAVLITFN